MSYSKKTCNKCGWRDIQPNMKQIEIEYESGSSKDAGSMSTYVAATFFNDKAASRRLNKTTWANNKRKYTRKRKVWVCKSNCGKHYESTPKPVEKPVSYESNVEYENLPPLSTWDEFGFMGTILRFFWKITKFFLILFGILFFALVLLR